MKKKLPKKFISKPKVVEVVQIKSPSISRSIPEIRLSSLPLKEIIVCVVSGVILLGIGFSSMRLYDTVKIYEAVQKEKQLFLKQKSYWENITVKYPQYRDAHFRLAVLAYQEGNTQQARQEIAKVLEIDPSFSEAREFLEKVESK